MGRLFLHYWPLLVLVGAIVPVGVMWYRDSPAASTPAGKLAAEWIEHGNEALARGDLAQALDDFNKAVDAQPDSAKAHERRAAAYWQLKKPDQALNDCDLALRFDSKLASASFTRGLVERDLGESDKALDDFTAALANGPEGVDVLTARGELYHSKAKAIVKSDDAAKVLDEALKDFNRAVELAPHQPACRAARAAVCLDLGDYETAVADCDGALEADPKLAVPKLAAVHVLRARAECELSEFDKAIADADLAVSLDGSLIDAHVVRARARLEKSSEMRTLEEVAECRRVATDCQTAIELAKAFEGDAEAMQHAKTMRGLSYEFRGAIYQSLHARTKALAEYERALAQDPYLVSALAPRRHAFHRGQLRRSAERLQHGHQHR